MCFAWSLSSLWRVEENDCKRFNTPQNSVYGKHYWHGSLICLLGCGLISVHLVLMIHQKHSYPCFCFLGFLWILFGIHCYPQHPKQDSISIGEKACRKLVKKLPQNWKVCWNVTKKISQTRFWVSIDRKFVKNCQNCRKLARNCPKSEKCVESCKIFPQTIFLAGKFGKIFPPKNTRKFKQNSLLNCLRCKFSQGKKPLTLSFITNYIEHLC